MCEPTHLYLAKSRCFDDLQAPSRHSGAPKFYSLFQLDVQFGSPSVDLNMRMDWVDAIDGQEWKSLPFRQIVLVGLKNFLRIGISGCVPASGILVALRRRNHPAPSVFPIQLPSNESTPAVTHGKGRTREDEKRSCTFCWR